MNMRAALVAALRRDPDLLSKLVDSLRERIDEENGRATTLVQAAEALEPVLAEALDRRPSRLTKLGLKSASLVASLALDDKRANRRLSGIAARGTVGIVFVDVSDFTAFTAAVGDEVAIDTLRSLSAMIEQKIRPYRGETVKQLGDGFLLAFPSASQAIRGACDLAAAARKMSEAVPGHQLRLRVAVHAGEPLVEGDDLLGHDVNLAARLLDHCNPGGVLVSEAAKELAEARMKTVHFGKRKLIKIRGLSTRVAVYGLSVSDRGARKPAKMPPP